MSTVVHATLGVLLLLALACGPSDPLQEIREQQGAGQFAAGIDPLRRIVDRDPSQTEAMVLLGRALLRTGSAGLAVWPLHKAAETPAYAVEAGLLLTQAMLESRTAHDAVEEIDRVLDLEPDNPQALVLRVDANRAAGNLEESLADIGRVLEREPGNLPVLVTRVTALIALDRIDEAGEALDAAQASFDAADGNIALPMLARLCIARALFAFQKGEREAAEKHYADCIERFPIERTAVSETVKFYDRIGQPDRATEILARAAEESETGLFRTLLARRLGAQGETEEEERLLREEAEERDSALAWFVLADHYVQRDLFDEAIDAFEHAVSLSSAPRLRFAYADTLVQAERFEKAREVAARLQQSELRHLIRGRILLGEGNARAALAAFESGIKLWPNNAGGRFLAGQAAERVGAFPRAISHYRESFRTNPRDTEAGLALAELYALQGEQIGALQIANRYLTAHAADPDAYLLAIRLSHALGRKQVVAQGLQRLGRLPGQAAVALAEEASILASAGAAEAAVQVIGSAGLDLNDPSNAIALRVLVEQLGVLGRHEDAESLVAQALTEHPDQATLHELHGSALHTGGRVDPARASYERALALDAKSWRALASLAALSFDADDPNQALALYDRSIAAGPEDPGAALAALAIVRDSDPEAAVVRLEGLLDTHPRMASAANELAEILADQGKLKRASIYASRAAMFRLPEAELTLARIEKLRDEARAAPESTPLSDPNQ